MSRFADGEWECHGDGWWRGRGCYLGLGVQLGDQLPTGINNSDLELGLGLHLHSDSSRAKGNAQEVRLLQELLAVAKALEVSSEALSHLRSLEKVLETAGDPVPNVERLSITIEHDVQAVDCIFDCIKGDKFSGLTDLDLQWKCAGNSEREVHPQYLADWIGEGLLSKLSVLALRFGSTTCEGLEKAVEYLASALKHANRLRSLSLTGKAARAGHSALLNVMLSSLQGLEELDLSDSLMGKADCEGYGKIVGSGYLPKLRILNIGFNPGIRSTGISAFGYELAKGLRNSFTHLNLDRILMGVDGITALATVFQSGSTQSMQDLSLNGNWLGEVGAKGLGSAISAGSLEELRSLRIGNNGLGERGAENLGNAVISGKLQSLESLDVGDNKIGTQGARALALACASGNLQALQRLDVGKNAIGDGGMEALEGVLAAGKLRALKALCLRSNKMGIKGAEALGRAFSSGNLQALQSLDAGDNEIGDAGAAALFGAFASGNSRGLRTLDAGGNGIGDRGANAVAGAFASRKMINLTSLNLEGNVVNDKGAIALAKSFQSGQASNLRVVLLSRNLFGDVGVMALAGALVSGDLNALSELEVLGLSGVSQEGAQAIVSAFASNTGLRVQVRFEWMIYPELDLRRKELVERNRGIAANMERLGKYPTVPATCSKVYVCGNPLAGKTTMRKSMSRTLLRSLLVCETRPHVENHTRGIHISRLIDKGCKPGERPITLLLWDMAGQDEYHLVHNAFFPDLTSAEGKATTFVIMCAPHPGSPRPEVEIEYWLRFIASSCGKSIQCPRQVFVVLNRKNGDQDVLNHVSDWKAALQMLSTRFERSLEIFAEPFVLDVRKRRAVEKLKKILMTHSRRKLQNGVVPEICHVIQANLSKWSEERKHFPVLCWAGFVTKVGDVPGLTLKWPENVIEAAAKYLHEAGELICIDKQFPEEYNVPSTKLVVLNPNWVCTEVVGNMFATTDMINRPHERVFRSTVNQDTGSISVSDFRKYFKHLGRWEDSELEYLLAILLWLGLCYKNGEDSVIIVPALIKIDERLESLSPDHFSFSERGEGQLVMGYSIEHQSSEIALAPIAVWHRFQVELGQRHAFNSQADNDFVVGKYSVRFKFDHMKVVCKVNASQESPTFDRIEFFVTPLRSASADGKFLPIETRRLRQVDLASRLVEILLKLWDQVCPGVEYVQRVIWPWPASCQCRPDSEEIDRRNVEVSKLKRKIQTHGISRPMHWQVGSEEIREDQLLSTKDKKNVLQLVQESNRLLTVGVTEAVKESVFPEDVLTDVNKLWSEGSPAPTEREIEGVADAAASTTTLLPSTPAGTLRFVQSLVEYTQKRLDVIDRKLDRIQGVVMANLEVSQQLRIDFTVAFKLQNDLLRKIQNMGVVSMQGNELTCPRFIYLAEGHSGAWMSLKRAVSPVVTAHVQFLCEARYEDHRPHPVTDQPGVAVRELKHWVEKLIPALKVTFTVLFILAKVAGFAIAPGVGSAFPKFLQWQQMSTLAEGIAQATGYHAKDLDDLVRKRFQPNPDGTEKHPQELFGESRLAMTEMLSGLTAREYRERLRLQKVRLSDSNSELAPQRVVWICDVCHEKYRSAGRLSA